MNDFEHYEDELDAIRNDIYERIKDMTPEERVNYFNSRAQRTADQYGVKIINDISEGIYAFEKRFFDGHAHQKSEHKEVSAKGVSFSAGSRQTG